MKKIPGISDAEWEVMQIIWDDNPVSANDIAEKLGPEKKWNSRTVKTLITRLVKKGVLNYTIDGKKYLYSPLFTREDYMEKESKSFMNKVFSGSKLPMLSFFVKSNELSEKEIEELKRMLDEKDTK